MNRSTTLKWYHTFLISLCVTSLVFAPLSEAIAATVVTTPQKPAPASVPAAKPQAPTSSVAAALPKMSLSEPVKKIWALENEAMKLMFLHKEAQKGLLRTMTNQFIDKELVKQDATIPVFMEDAASVDETTPSQPVAAAKYNEKLGSEKNAGMNLPKSPAQVGAQPNMPAIQSKAEIAKLKLVEDTLKAEYQKYLPYFAQSNSNVFGKIIQTLVQPKGGAKLSDDDLVKVALLFFTTKFRQLVGKPTHTIIPNLMEDPECAGGLVESQNFLRYGINLNLGIYPYAHADLNMIAQQIECVDTTQLGLIDWAFSKAISETLAILPLEKHPDFLQYIINPALIVYDAQKVSYSFLNEFIKKYSFVIGGIYKPVDIGVSDPSSIPAWMNAKLTADIKTKMMMESKFYRLSILGIYLMNSKNELVLVKFAKNNTGRGAGSVVLVEPNDLIHTMVNEKETTQYGAKVDAVFATFFNKCLNPMALEGVCIDDMKRAPVSFREFIERATLPAVIAYGAGRLIETQALGIPDSLGIWRLPMFASGSDSGSFACQLSAGVADISMSWCTARPGVSAFSGGASVQAGGMGQPMNFKEGLSCMPYGGSNPLTADGGAEPASGTCHNCDMPETVIKVDKPQAPAVEPTTPLAESESEPTTVQASDPTTPQDTGSGKRPDDSQGVGGLPIYKEPSQKNPTGGQAPTGGGKAFTSPSQTGTSPQAGVPKQTGPMNREIPNVTGQGGTTIIGGGPPQTSGGEYAEGFPSVPFNLAMRLNRNPLEGMYEWQERAWTDVYNRGCAKDPKSCSGEGYSKDKYQKAVDMGAERLSTFALQLIGYLAVLLDQSLSPGDLNEAALETILQGFLNIKCFGLFIYSEGGTDYIVWKDGAGQIRAKQLSGVIMDDVPDENIESLAGLAASDGTIYLNATDICNGVETPDGVEPGSHIVAHEFGHALVAKFFKNVSEAAYRAATSAIEMELAGDRLVTDPSKGTSSPTGGGSSSTSGTSQASNSSGNQGTSTGGSGANKSANPLDDNVGSNNPTGCTMSQANARAFQECTNDTPKNGGGSPSAGMSSGSPTTAGGFSAAGGSAAKTQPPDWCMAAGGSVCNPSGYSGSSSVICGIGANPMDMSKWLRNPIDPFPVNTNKAPTGTAEQYQQGTMQTKSSANPAIQQQQQKQTQTPAKKD